MERASLSTLRATTTEPRRRGARDTPSQGRIAGVDALRAIALVAMIAYHFSFDLRYFGVIKADFEHDIFWLTARTIILSSFLLLAGVSLVLADARNTPPTHFWRHVATIAACALLVSAASYSMFPTTFIWFGVLHAIAVALVLARPFVQRPRVALAIGVLAIAAGVTFSNVAFDSFTLGWIGFMTGKPYTEDYVPLFPWAGVLFCGIAAGHLLVRNRFAVLAPLATPPRWLAWIGRHTLAVYMLHQPILLGLLMVIVRR
jgi:uncharacterized membrane protein